MPCQAAASLLFVVCLWTPTGGSQPQHGPPPTQAEIERAIVDLGSAEFRRREEASDFLWRAGKAAAEAVSRAIHSDDPEVALRAKQLHFRFRYGIFPDTPVEIVRLILQFRDGAAAAKQKAFEELATRGKTDTMLALLDTVEDQSLRRRLTDTLSRLAKRHVFNYLIEGDDERAQTWLRLSTGNRERRRDYAVYLLLRGKIDQAIVDLEATDREAREHALLAELYRARGDLAAARKIVEHCDDKALRREILTAVGDWAALARWQEALPGREPETDPFGPEDRPAGTDTPPKDGIPMFPTSDELNWATAYYRLAGETENLDHCVKALQAMVEKDNSDAWYCGEALLINDRFEDAIAMFKKHRRTSALDLLIAQHRFQEAFQLCGIDDPRASYDDWFDRLEQRLEKRLGEIQKARPGPFDLPGAPPAAAPAKVRPSEAPELSRLARLMSELGRTEDSRRLFAMLADHLLATSERPPYSLIEAERKAGFHAEAFAHAARALDREDGPNLLGTLFPEPRHAAKRWWDYSAGWKDEADAESPQLKLARLHALLSPQDKRPLSDHSFEPLKIIRDAADFAAGLEPKEHAAWLGVLGDTCRLHDYAEEADEYYFQAAELQPTVLNLLRAGDAHRENKDFAQAAEVYGLATGVGEESVQRLDLGKPPAAGDPFGQPDAVPDAHKTHDRTPLAFYLQGWSLTQAGREDEGRRLTDLARVLPLGDTRSRQMLAEGLNDRGWKAEAIDDWDLVVRIGPVDDWHTNRAAQNLGNAVGGQEFHRAADGWQRVMLSVLEQSTSFLETKGYLKLPHLVHKTRARALLQDGKPEEAIRELERARQALPGSVTLPVTLIPELEQAGRTDAADHLFEKVHAVLARTCQMFPDGALHRNNLAWMSAKCGRRLEEALNHAQAAVALKPDSAGHRDTLAEVHFARGDREEAIRQIQTCIAMQPDNPFFQKQLARFRGETEPGN
jgi:hypothetical protein